MLIELTEGTWTSSLGRTIARFKPTGLVFRKLISPDASLELCREAARVLDVLPFIAIEEEGDGALTGLFPPLPRVLTLKLAQAADAGQLIGRAMSAFGLNLNLAPTLDVEPPAPTMSGVEETSCAKESPPAEVARRAESFVRALSSQHVLCCGRHFPGLPLRTAARPEEPEGKPIVVERSLAALWREDLVPYRTLGDKLATVEISHAVHRAYDYEFLQPASLSSGVIEGLLRTKLRYEGLALANGPLAAEAAGVDLDEAVIRALAAGCDLVTVPAEPKLLEGICQSVERATDAGRLSSARLSEATRRVKAVRKLLRRPARQMSKRQYSRLERDWEHFARNWTDRSDA